MAKRDILPIFPSRANSVIMKQRVLAARRGVGLLKRKRDAIDMKLRELKRHLNEKDELVDEVMREAIFSMAKARLLGADFKPQIVGSSKVDTAKIRRTQIKIVGVTLNCLELEIKSGGGAGFPLAGLSCGGVQVLRIRDCYTKALAEIVQCASIVYQVRMLEAGSRQTNMRVNALEHVVIPVLQNTSNYITGELEEFEREDFYRLKRSQAKQLEAKLAFSELIKTKNMTVEELAFHMKRGTAFVHPVADVHFDYDEFDESRVKKRVREARKSLSTSIASPQKSTTFTASRIVLGSMQRQRNPSAEIAVDLYSTKRLIHGRKSSQISQSQLLARTSQFRERLVEQMSRRNTQEPTQSKSKRNSLDPKPSKSKKNNLDSKQSKSKSSTLDAEQSKSKGNTPDMEQSKSKSNTHYLEKSKSKRNIQDAENLSGLDESKSNPPPEKSH